MKDTSLLTSFKTFSLREFHDKFLELYTLLWCIDMAFAIATGEKYPGVKSTSMYDS